MMFSLHQQKCKFSVKQTEYGVQSAGPEGMLRLVITSNADDNEKLSECLLLLCLYFPNVVWHIFKAKTIFIMNETSERRKCDWHDVDTREPSFNSFWEASQELSYKEFVLLGHFLELHSIY